MRWVAAAAVIGADAVGCAIFPPVAILPAPLETWRPPASPARLMQVRLRLEAAGILIMDTPEGTTWKPGPRLHIAEEENAAAATPAAV